jgi:hypothetical protein
MVGRIGRIKIIGIIILTLAVIAPEAARADWKLYYKGGLANMPGSHGVFAPGIGNGSFSTHPQCDAYRSSRPLAEQNDSYCSGFDSPSYTPSAPSLDPSQAFAVQMFGGLLNQLFSSVFSTNKTNNPDPALIQRKLAEERAREPLRRCVIL